MDWKRVFKIYGSELGRVMQFAGLGALLMSGLTVGISAGDSLFLSNVGVEHLPYIYLVMPVIMLFYASLFSYLITRWGLKRLMSVTVAMVSAVALVIYLLLGLRESLPGWQLTVLYYGIKIFTTVIYIAFYSLFWNFTDLYFDMLESKRLYAFFAAGSAFGVMSGGLVTSLSAGALGVAGLFLVWAVIGALTLPFLAVLTKANRELETAVTEEEPVDSPVRLLLRYGNTILRNRYVTCLAGMVFLVAMLAGLAEYQYYEIFSQRFSEEQLATELGWLYAMVNLFNILVCLFLFNRLVLRAGVTAVALIQPVVYVIAFSFLLLQYGYASAVFAFFAYQGMSLSVDNNNYNLLYNALPSRSRAQLRTILEGLLEPVATAAAGIFLIWYAPRIPPEGISMAGFGGAILLFLVVLLANRDYMNSIVQNLKTQWLDFSRRFADMVTGLGPQELKLVEARTGGALGEALMGIRILRYNRSKRALKSALTVVERFGERSGEVMGGGLKEEINELIDGTDYAVIVDLLDWIESQPDYTHSEMIEELAANRLMPPAKLKHLLHSPDPRRKGIALTGMLVSWDLAEVERALLIIDELFEGDREEILTAVRVLGHGHNPQYAHFLLPLIGHDDSRIRTAALQSLRDIVDRRSHAVIRPVLDLLPAAGGKDRLYAFDILERVGDPECLVPLLAMSPFFTPYERRKVEEILAGMGTLVVPRLVSVVGDVNTLDRARTLGARVLYRVAPEQFKLIFEDIIADEVRKAYRFLCYYHLLDRSGMAGDAIDLLKRFYMDAQTNKINFILEILTTVGRLPAYELIANSLRSSSPKVRSYALEALEQGVSREIHAILLPLVDGRPLEETLSGLEELGLRMPGDVTEALAAGARTEYSIEKSAILVQYWESNDPAALPLLRECLRRTDDTLVTGTARALLENGGDRSVVQKLVRLVRAKDLEGCNILELRYLAERCELLRYPAGDAIYAAGDKAERLYLLAEGGVALDGGPEGGAPEAPSPGARRVIGAGSLFGEESIRGRERYACGAHSEGCEVLVFRRETLEQCGGLYPNFAINLLLRGMP